MRKLLLFLGSIAAFAGCGPQPEPPVAPAAASPTTTLEIDAIVDTYRRILVLMSDEATLAEPDRPRAFLAGKLLFERNRQKLASLEEAGRAALEASQASSFRSDPQPLLLLLDRLEQDVAWHDANKGPRRPKGHARMPRRAGGETFRRLNCGRAMRYYSCRF